MTFAQWLPWCLLALVLAVGFWQRRRYTAMLQAQHATEATLQTTRISLQRISQAVESASDAIGIGDMEGTSLYHNRAHIDLFGYTVGELNAVPGAGALFADPVVAAEIHADIRAGRSWAGETLVKTKAGAHIPAFVRANLIRDDYGAPVGIFGVFTDITERRRFLQSLDAEHQRLGLTLQSIADGVITTDALGRVELVNRVAEELTGWTQAEAQGQPLKKVLPLCDEHTRESRSPHAARSSSGSPNLPRETGCVLVTRDGKERLIAEKSALLHGTAGAAASLVIVFHDITVERTQALERERANKLESLGLLAGGIAHDFANLLTLIIGHLSLAQIVEGLPENINSRLTQVERAAWRAKDLTQQLLTFSKGGATVKRILPLESLLRESVGFALQGAPDAICHFSAAPDLWLVEADAGQLGQVFNNIALNAVQAMESRGTLTVRAENLGPGPEQGADLAAFRVVHVSLADTGPGISAENLAKIFDPFFTTKAKGTGLGLATVYSIVKNHGGRLHVESTVGAGATFHIYLRAAPPGAIVAATHSAPPFRAGASGPARVLLMEHQPAAREAVSLLLVLLGYEAESAGDGQQAIDRYLVAKNAGRPFGAVILDLRAPSGPTSAEIIQQLRAIDPNFRAIVASGYAEDPAMEEHLATGFHAAVTKPIKMENLRAVLEPIVHG